MIKGDQVTDTRERSKMMRLSNKLAACLLSGVLLAPLATYAQDIPVTADVQSSGKFAIASSLGYAPFEFLDENGKPAGLDIDLANAVAKLLGAELNIETAPFASQIPGLASGRYKVGWATFSVTGERLAQVDFVTFLQAGSVAVTSPDKKDRFADKANLCDATVAVQSGTAADFAADKLSEECTAAGKGGLKKAIYPEQKDVIQAVTSGRADAYLDDSTSAGYYETTSGGQLVVAGNSFYPTPLGVAIAKGDTATADMMKAAFEKLIADGTYAEILTKYNMQTSAATDVTVYTEASQLTP
ncbi:ABC transporter substrate-binding protein [Devosia sp. A369]